MKKIEIIIRFLSFVMMAWGMVILFVVGCSRDEPKKSVANWDNNEPIVEEREIRYTKSSIESDGINSYWFVVVQNKENGTMMNAFIKQNHSYFSDEEALGHFGKAKDYFLLNFEEISEASFISCNQN